MDSVFESRALNANLPTVVELSDEATFRFPVPAFLILGNQAKISQSCKPLRINTFTQIRNIPFSMAKS